MKSNRKLGGIYETSTEEQEAEKGHSVYDFIYVDRDRISLLLSQLNDLGEMTSVLEGKEAGRSSDKSEDFEISGDVFIASGGFVAQRPG